MAKAQAMRNAAGTKIFILYDARARVGDTDDATALVTANTERECRRYRGDFGRDAIWFEYTFNEKGEADNETPRFDIPA